MGLDTARLNELVAQATAELACAGPQSRMAVIRSLEEGGLGFHEAIAVVAHGLESGSLERCGPDSSDLRAPPSSRARRVVLVVEDDDAIRDELVEVLLEAGYQVVEATDGQRAMERLSETPLPALVLLDLILPLATGFDVLAWMQRVPSLAAVPVCVLTAMGEALRVQGARVLTKPVLRETLVGAVAELCGRPGDDADAGDCGVLPEGQAANTRNSQRVGAKPGAASTRK